MIHSEYLNFIFDKDPILYLNIHRDVINNETFENYTHEMALIAFAISIEEKGSLNIDIEPKYLYEKILYNNTINVDTLYMYLIYDYINEIIF